MVLYLCGAIVQAVRRFVKYHSVNEVKNSFNAHEIKLYKYRTDGCFS